MRAVTSGPGSVMVSWRPPGSPNGVIKKYTVFRREVMNGEEVAVKESSVLSGPNYLELTGLEWNRRYDVWVKAATDVGYGSSSIITSIILGRIGKIERSEGSCLLVNYSCFDQDSIDRSEREMGSPDLRIVFVLLEWMAAHEASTPVARAHPLPAATAVCLIFFLPFNPASSVAGSMGECRLQSRFSLSALLRFSALPGD